MIAILAVSGDAQVADIGTRRVTKLEKLRRGSVYGEVLAAAALQCEHTDLLRPMRSNGREKKFVLMGVKQQPSSIFLEDHVLEEV